MLKDDLGRDGYAVVRGLFSDREFAEANMARQVRHMGTSPMPEALRSALADQGMALHGA